MKEAEDYGKMFGQKTILFIDEIHRFNRAQQDAFLPHVERGDIVLIGATTENPSFEVNAALLSRSKVYVLRQLAKSDIRTVIDRAMTDQGSLEKHVQIG
jgi:putative ATPase